MKLQALPKLGEQIDGGIFAGLTTNKNGAHCAVVLLPGNGSDLDWSDAKSWATEQGGELPNRSVAALLFDNVEDQLRPEWHWTSDELRVSSAWACGFSYGHQFGLSKTCKGSAIAVRLVPLED